MDVVEKPIDDIIPYEKNPRHNDEAPQYGIEFVSRKKDYKYGR